jgi:hypothetical protein
VTSAPTVEYPRDLPDLRLWLLDQWRVGGPLEEVAQLLDSVAGTVIPHVRPGMSYMTEKFDRPTLKDATLWWVTPDMVDLVDHASRTLDVTLTHDMIPDKAGFVYLEKPLIGIDADMPDRTVEVTAVMWGFDDLPPLYGQPAQRALSISSYRRVTIGDEKLDEGLFYLSSTILTAMQRRTAGGLRGDLIKGDIWVPLGRTDWAFGQNANAPIFEDVLSPNQQDSMAEDRRWLATIWLLASQPRLASIGEEKPSAPVRRRSERRDTSSNVRIVNVRQPVRSNGDGEHRRVEWSHRWIVSTHWRNQAYGPGRSLRRPTLILPYVKGPADKPLQVRQTVKVIK